MTKKELLIAYKDIIKLVFKMFKNLYIVNKSANQELADDVIDTNLEELVEQNARLRLRKEALERIQNFNFDNDNYLDLATILNDTNLLEALVKILDSNLDNKTKEKAMAILNKIQYLDGIEEINLNEIIRYYKIKNKCIYQDIIKFIDQNFSYLCKDYYCVRSLNDIIENYTEEKMDKSFTNPDRIIDNIDSLDDLDFAKKDKKTFITVVNGIFMSYASPMPLIDDESFTDEKRNKMLSRILKRQELNNKDANL